MIGVVLYRGGGVESSQCLESGLYYFAAVERLGCRCSGQLGDNGVGQGYRFG